VLAPPTIDITALYAMQRIHCCVGFFISVSDEKTSDECTMAAQVGPDLSYAFSVLMNQAVFIFQN
jgi:hypothetical protein